MDSQTRVKAIYPFLAVGLIGFFIDALIFFTSINILSVSLATGRTLASVIAISSTWILNRNITFAKKKSTNVLREWARYSVSSVVGALGNFLTLSCVSQFDGTLFHIPAYLFGTASGLGINFFLYKTIVFPTQTD